MNAGYGAVGFGSAESLGCVAKRTPLADDVSSAVKFLEEAANDFAALSDTLVGTIPAPLANKDASRIGGGGVFDSVRTDVERIRRIAQSVIDNAARIRGAL